MKKSLVFFVLFTMGISFAYAQPTLSSSNNPIPGQRYYYRVTDTIAQPGPSGSGQTWNFMTVQVTLNTTQINYVTPSATPYGSSFSSANLASYSQPGEYDYYSTSATGWAYKGKGSASDIATITGSNYLLFSYPFQFGTTITNTISGTTGFGTISGTVTVTGDGTGTLRLQTGTYNNVLRVKREENIIFNFGPGVDEYVNTVSYLWYSANYGGPIMKIVTSTTSGIATAYSKTVGVADFVLSVDNPSAANISGLSIFPNPASGAAELRFSVENETELSFRILDLTGRIWKEWSQTSLAGVANIRLDVADLPRGIYIVSAKAEGILREQRLILE